MLLLFFAFLLFVLAGVVTLRPKGTRTADVAGGQAYVASLHDRSDRWRLQLERRVCLGRRGNHGCVVGEEGVSAGAGSGCQAVEVCFSRGGGRTPPTIP